MPAYIVANNYVTDYEGSIGAYRANVTQLAQSFGGRYLARGVPTQVLEGQWLKSQRNVMSVWPDAKDAENFWFSEDYQKNIRPNRAGTAFNSIGLFTGEADAPAPNPANAYLLAIVNRVGTPDDRYGAAAAKLVAQHGGRYLVRGALLRTLEGEWYDRTRVVVIAFPSLSAATDMWQSQAYQNDVKPLRAPGAIYDVAVFAEEKAAH